MSLNMIWNAVDSAPFAKLPPLIAETVPPSVMSIATLPASTPPLIPGLIPPTS